MRTRSHLGAQALAVAAAAILLAAHSQAQELRAFWADAFSPAIKSRDEVDTMLRRLRTANCNAVFVQVRKGGDAYYVSHYEPWASDNPQRFDGLAYLIQQAHAGRPRIQVHAWINTCAVGRSRGNPLHVAVSHPEWLSISDKGEEYDGEATKVDPGNPDAADHTFRIYLDVLRHYDVDGIHFDFVRYGGANWGYNPVSVARFNARSGRSGKPAPTDPLWQQWRRDQVTALVRKVYAMATAIKPRVAVSAATITWGQGPTNMDQWRTKSAAMTRVFQDWRAWMEEGILDLNCMMSYYSEARYPQWFRLWLDWAKDHQYARHAVPSSGVWLNTVPDSMKQISAIRAASKSGNRPKGGVLLYCYAGTNATPDGRGERYSEAFYSALSQAGRGPFARPAVPPALPWKTTPTTGHVKGFVLDANSLLPVDGAAITLSGPARRAARSDGTGFFAFIDVPQGAGRVTVAGPGYSPRIHTVAIERGRTASVTVLLGSSAAPFAPGVGALLEARDGAPARLSSAVVVGGSDRFPGRAFLLTPQSPSAVEVVLPAAPMLPLLAGDVVAVSGAMATLDGEKVIRAEAVRLIDMLTPPVEKEGAVWTVAGSRGQSPGRLMAPGVLRASGVVTAHTPTGFLLATDSGARVEVVLTGRKDCGVEDAETAIPTPGLLSRVAVVGVVTVAIREGVQIARVRPRAFEDLHLLGSSASTAVRMAGLVASGPFRDAGRLPLEAKKQ